MCRIRLCAVLLGLAARASSATATPYWITYEGDDFPENEGWTRVHGSIPAERWIEDGVLFIDSRAQVGVFDWSRMSFPGVGALGPGETFVMRWRLKVDFVSNFADPGVQVISDDQYSVGFIFAENRIWSLHEANTWAFFEPGQFHEYELRSVDMRAYELSIDGTAALAGAFFGSAFARRVEWGDAGTDQSLGEWDRVEFGITPEPGTCLTALGALLLSRRR